MKDCSKCKRSLPRGSFYEDKRSRTGLQSQCKECCLEKMRGAHVRRKATDPVRYKGVKTRTALKALYGITPCDFTRQRLMQQDTCAICKASEPGRSGTWFVDHDHATGQLRGLLCGACNTALGMARDSVDVLAAAIAYLENGGVWTRSA